MEKESQTKLHLAPPEPDIGETDGFAKSDIFGHADFGGRLANIVRDLQTPLVLALTGGWGSGKSVFAKQWAGELRKRWAKDGDDRKPEDAPVIYFDAFANDHQDNALFALAGEVMEFIGRRGKATDGVRESAARIAKGVGSVLAEGIARYATGGLANAADIAAAMESALEKRMKEAEQGRDAIREFRCALENAAKELGGGQPLVFIVDELDRCRPDFALELLEKIKHLFSVPNVCFLVVTNLEQFEAVVQRAYGYNKEEARVYLEKFFHYVFWLPKEGENGNGQVVDYVRHIWNILPLPRDRVGEFSEWLKGLCQTHEFSLRDIERMLAPMVLAYAGESILRRAHHDADVLYIATVLCVLRKIDSAAYRKILQATATWEDMPELLKKNSGAYSRLEPLQKEMSNEKKDLTDIAKAIENYAR